MKLNELIRRKPDGDKDSPKKEPTTEAQRQKRKKMLVYPLMGLLFLGSMWLIFAPSSEDREEEQAGTGFNTDMPLPADAVIIGDKKKAYEQASLEARQKERSRAVQDLSSLFGDGDAEEESPDTGEYDLLNPGGTSGKTGYAAGSGSARSNITSSAEAYHDINTTLGSFYSTPEEDPEKEELRRRVEELETMMAEQESQPSSMDEQIALLEKSYELAAKYMPGGQDNGHQSMETVADADRPLSVRDGKPAAVHVENADEVDFDAAGKAVMAEMKKVNPKAVWVVQGWTENPRPEMIKNLNNGDLLILDLFSECRPMWGIPSIWKRDKGYEQHDWLFCMLENFGGNVGLHGRMDQLLNNFYLTKNNPLAAHLKGIGLTMEGSENNPVMFELMCELPWRPEKFTKEEWLKDYVFARYGVRDEKIEQAWMILANSIYNCPFGNNQQGPHESIFCGRPTLNNFQASSWSKMQNYYDPTVTAEAAALMVEVADKYRGNNNFEYDLVDMVRQAISDEARIVYNRTVADFKSFDKRSFARDSKRFLDLLLMQDSLLGTRSEFRVGRWIQQARKLGNTSEEKDLYEWNARVQITTWGNRTCADDGGLRDYAHKEWNGILRDFYYMRWSAYWKTLQDQLDGKPEVKLDYYAMEEPWTRAKNPYTAEPEGDCIEMAKKAIKLVRND